MPANKTKKSRLTSLGWVERLGYGAGDAGFNLYWTTIASFLAAFYTDVFGIGAAAAGTMMLVTKLVDAFTDPIMGGIADRTRTRFGKFRPYLLWGGVPLGLFALLTFTTPDWSDSGKLLWAYVTFTMMMVCYTIVSTPYSALSGVLTASSQERTTLISIRFIFAFGCGALVNRYTLPLVEMFGQGDDKVGWQSTMMLYAILAFTFFVFTFLSTKERIQPVAVSKSTVKEDLKDLLNNKPWLVLFALAMIIMMTITMRAGSSYYYLKYYLERPDLISSYLFWQMIAYAVGASLTPIVTRYIDKVRLLVILMSIVGVLSIAFFFVPKDAIAAIFTINIMISLALGPKSPLTWSMYADSADYNEWKNNRRATAMTFSAATFSQKLGGAMGSAIMLWVLAWLGYSANEAQSGSSLTGINLLQTIIPGVFAMLAVFCLRFYQLDSKQINQIQSDLQKRDEQPA